MIGTGLRAGLFVAGGLLVFAGVMLVRHGFIPAAWLTGIGLILIGGLLIERWRYKQLDAPRPGPDWQATGERFVDPESGKLVAVYFHPTTGERRYVAL